MTSNRSSKVMLELILNTGGTTAVFGTLFFFCGGMCLAYGVFGLSARPRRNLGYDTKTDV